jgi:hypothetical protein
MKIRSVILKLLRVYRFTDGQNDLGRSTARVRTCLKWELSPCLSEIRTKKFQSAQTLYQRFPNCGVRPLLVICGGAEILYIRNIFILNQVWAHDKIYIFVDSFLVEIFSN